MEIRDLYAMLDSIYGLKGVNIIAKDSVTMYLPEALSITYLDHSRKKVKKFSFENGYFDIYI